MTDFEKYKKLWFSYDDREKNFPIGCTIRKLCLIRKEYKYGTVISHEKDSIYPIDSLILIVRWIDEARDKRIRLIQDTRLERFNSVTPE